MSRYFERHTYVVTKSINAPLKFTYAWCTDYREDDNRITGSKTETKILQRTNRRVILVRAREQNGKTMLSVKIIALHPPNAWYLDQVGEDEDVVGLYKLTRVGQKKTRLHMTFTEKYKILDAPTKEQDRIAINQMWEKYVVTLENDYASKG